MEMVTAVLILIGLYGSVILEAVLLIWWLKKNNINIQITEGKEGVYLSNSGRYRITNGKFYKMLDILKRKPLEITEKEAKDYFIITEGVPFIGIKLTLKLFKGVDDKGVEKLEAWFPVYNDDIKPEIDNLKIAFTETTRKDLYESTKMEMSKAEIMQKIVLPMSMLILAIACLIFFPKVYAAIKLEGNIAIKTAISSMSEMMESLIPLG